MSDDLHQALDKFAGKIKGEVAIAGVAAMAKAVYDSARANVPVQSGTLRNSIYRVLSKDNTNKDKITYHVAWNHKKAPHGHLIEFGTSRAPAHPFLYPALEQNKDKLSPIAQSAMKAALEKT